MATAVQAQVFFSEDFEGGGIPADWMAMEVAGNGQAFSNWVYTTVGPEGPFSTGPLESTSSDNGWVMFDSDSNCNIMMAQEAWLITPAIDCSDKDVVILQYENLWRVFNDRAQIRVGTDLNDLANWALYDPYGTLSNNDWGN
ncbi:MAG: choice-of-anchor J domain-containing protein, partial [Bacteroidota bacterium]